MPPEPRPILPSDREYLLARRQALLIELAAIERRLDLRRSVPSKHERDQADYERRHTQPKD